MKKIVLSLLFLTTPFAVQATSEASTTPEETTPPPMPTEVSAPAEATGSADAEPAAGPVLIHVPVKPLIASFTELPTPLRAPAPVYTDDLRKKGLQGRVVLEFLVSEKGTVLAVSEVKSPHAELTAAAKAAVKEWSFVPAMNDGEPVAVAVRVPFEFRIETPPLLAGRF